MTYALRYAVRSDVGVLREGNEDSAYAGPHLLAVADGMGGYEAGEVASASVIKSVAPLDTRPMPESDLVDAVAAAVTKAKQNLRAIVEADPAVGSMGTTLTAMLWSGATAAIVHIGDSRAYLLRDDDLYQITRDHTFVQALIDQGRIRPDEAANHPQRSLLLRALDGRTDADPDLSVLTAELGDRFLLCSDGLPVVVSDEEIRQTLADIPEPSDAVLQLIDLAIRGGGPDNITCIVADVIDTEESRLAATRAPVLAGAAASAGNEQTMQFSRSAFDTDAGLTRFGATPPGARDGHNDQGAYGDSGPHSGAGPTTAPQPVLPDQEPAQRPQPRTTPRQAQSSRTADSSPPAAAAASRGRHGGQDDLRGGRRRRGVPVISILLGIFVLIIAVAVVIGYEVIHNQYYVGNNGGKVAIFRGMNDKVLGHRLYSVYTPTDIPISGIPAASAQEVARNDTGSLAMAQQFVSNIRKQYTTCQTAEARLHTWETTTPPPVTVKVNKHGKTINEKRPGKRGPKPVVPSDCPAPAGT
ncbi:MAG TPA: protein phosphatase 2C domain-containing protein [Streptosporangiaceae bacterium]|nr:protein phosphatase 2C domain-containing protein [Streptosporangiaceae bacterium]